VILVTHSNFPSPALPWPERVVGLFEDGPLAGQLLQVPARSGLPPLTVGVLLDQADQVVEVRAGNEHPADVDRRAAEGWLLYLRGPAFGSKRSEPHTFHGDQQDVNKLESHVRRVR